ncbi:MAG TPA: hypothetical protein VLJ11_14360 [Bryobacteraceae bacterium]|nr:hypothetical protein [Bryobacteraceae bacterium]
MNFRAKSFVYLTAGRCGASRFTGREDAGHTGKNRSGPVGDGDDGRCDGAGIAERKYFVGNMEFGKLGEIGSNTDCG